ncbi:hypothetical protein PV10_01104 [Exophiala mesophila]|uniref:Uncharacterized protein n=1 Tax=Exophiala mesophila TaxID=212818 RepID=A0A0D1ZRW3_EXOME|nr:uncharacterized protein PV10_01104 [Exophiala mesophila]KIV97342.1 hypothetical protein PV10_01104 [Exophiala mesophila]
MGTTSMEVDYATKQADTMTRIELLWKQRPTATACDRCERCNTSLRQRTYFVLQTHHPAEDYEKARRPQEDELKQISTQTSAKGRRVPSHRCHQSEDPAREGP